MTLSKTFDPGYGRGDVNTPPFFTNRFKPLARVTLYLTDENTSHNMLGAAWLTNADACYDGDGISFRLKWFLNGGSSLTQNRWK